MLLDLMSTIILMKTHLPKKQLMLELIQQVLSIIWLKERKQDFTSLRHSQRSMGIQAMILLFYVRVMKQLLVILEKTLSRVVQVMIQLTVEAEMIPPYSKIYLQPLP